jgi:hypothetical protein
LRIKYLLHEIDDDVFKKELQRRNKHNRKTKEILDILTMFTHTVSDLMRSIVHNLELLRVEYGLSKRKIRIKTVTLRHHVNIDADDFKEDNCEDSTLDDVLIDINVFDKLRDYVNEQFVRVGKVYNARYPYVSDGFEYQRFKIIAKQLEKNERA